MGRYTTKTDTGRRSSVEEDPRLAQRPVALSSVFSTILLAETITHVLPETATVVVDVGGGEAPYAGAIGSTMHLAVDRRAPDFTLATDQVVGDACRLPVGDSAADLVLCTEVVEHVPDDRVLYAELRRIVTDDGLLVLSAPFVHALHESPHDYRRPTSAGLVHGLTTAGFAVETIDAVGGTGDVLADLLIRSAGPKVSAVARRMPGSLGRSARLTFRRVQRSLADRSLRRVGDGAAGIDPLQPHPRLALGYVVLARPVPRPQSSKSPTA